MKKLGNILLNLGLRILAIFLYILTIGLFLLGIGLCIGGHIILGIISLLISGWLSSKLGLGNQDDGIILPEPHSFPR